MALSNLRMLELNAVELQKLHSLDIHGQRFSATLWMEFLIRGGRNDPDLTAKGSVFPIGPDGKPTFKPSAGWLMEQADFRNALSVRTIDNKVMMRGDDVVLVMRYEGVFTEIYELTDFPVDQQGLTITLNINCRTTGPMPVELFVGDECTLSMECAVLCPPARQWTLAPELRVLAHRIGSGDRKFPALSFTARVYRMPRYFVLYMGAPPCLFSLLAVLQNFVGWFLGQAGAHPRAQLSLMLVLTASAYQMAISNKLPPVSYLTLLDRWLLYNYLIIIVVALQSRVVSFFDSDELGATETPYHVPDYVLSWTTAAFWLLVNAYFLFVIWQKWHQPVIRDEFLGNPDSKLLGVTRTPCPHDHNTPPLAHQWNGALARTGRDVPFRRRRHGEDGLRDAPRISGRHKRGLQAVHGRQRRPAALQACLKAQGLELQE